MQMKHMGFLYAGMHQADAHRVSQIGLEDWGLGIPEHPTGVVLFLVHQDVVWIHFAGLDPTP